MPFLDVSPWYFTEGRICGDGSAFALIGVHGPYPFPGDVYVYDFETRQLTKVSPTTTDLIRSLSISHDGSQVLYGSSQGPLFAVKSDGSDHHLVKPDWSPPGGVAITRDGRHIFYQDGVTYAPVIRKATWEGEVVATITGLHNNLGNDIGQIPIDVEGEIMAFVDYTIPSPWDTWGHLGVWFEQPPVLTTYGHGVPGTTLYLDLGGQPGDGYVLAFATSSAAQPFKHYGVLGLDPASLHVLAVGRIPPTGTTASLELLIPPAAPIVGPLPVYFQALVFDGPGPAGKLTNTTVFTLDAESDSLAVSVGPPADGLGSQRVAHISLPPVVETPEEALQRMMLEDPALWWRLEGSRSGGVLEQTAATQDR